MSVPRKYIIIATAAVGAVGALAVLYRLTARSSSSSRGGVITFNVDEDPHRATREVIHGIRHGKTQTVGEIVNLVRGPVDRTPEGQKLSNAYRIRAPSAFIHFARESYMPAARGDSRPDRVAERTLIASLVASDHSLAVLERERATSFDNDNRSHVNLLQQLWVACGMPSTTYARTGSQWGELGFQGDDPVTDLRGGGVLALRMLVHFAQRHPTAIKEMLAYNRRVQDAQGDSWYLLAVVSIQFSAQLILQKDHPFYQAHLEVIYDTMLSATAASGAAGGARLTARRNIGSSSSSTSEYVSDAEAGLFLLHEALLLCFKECWERDEPHVMSYNQYVQEKVFARFFCGQWSLPADLLK